MTSEQATSDSLLKLKRNIFQSPDPTEATITNLETISSIENFEREIDTREVTENLGDESEQNSKHESDHHIQHQLEEEPDENKSDENSETQRDDILSTPKSYKLNSAKQYYCPYCRNLYSKFARHLFQVHSGEKEIENILKLPPNHKERKRVIAVLRGKGAKIFNNLSTSPEKIIIPRIKKHATRDDYIPCHMCGNMYKKRFLHRHVKRCPNSDGTVSRPLKEAKAALFTDKNEAENAIQFSRDILPGIYKGEIKRVIETDCLLKSYGHYLCNYYGQDTHLLNLIRRKLRYIAEVLIEFKTVDNEIQHLEDVFQPRKLQALFFTIKKVTGFEAGNVKRATMAIDLSPILQQCARRLIIQASEKDDDEKIKIISRWIDLLKSEYNVAVAKQARRSLEERKWNKPRLLPLTEDILKLNKYVKSVIENTKRILEDEFNYIEWANFNKAVMIQTMIFNRKRAGDVQRMKIQDFKKAHNVQKGSATYELLSESEKIFCSQYMRIEVRGKHAKVVPMLLSKEMMKNIEEIISMRKVANIPSSNPYVFARKDDLPFEMSPVLTEFAFACHAQNPNLLTGTKMRQQIATVTQAFNFSTNELSLIAHFLGHTLETHAKFYRLADEAVQLGKISKVLQAVDSGKTEQIKGKSLNELEQIIETLDLDSSNENDNENQGKFFFLLLIM